jgi:hypothetical protein
MNAQTFDRLVADAVRRPTRRSALRLLAAGFLGTVPFAPVAHAQRADTDEDGLFDDDETDVYGTDPFNPDTDGDNVSDGQEIYNRDNGLGGNADPLVNENAVPEPPTPTLEPSCFSEGCGPNHFGKPELCCGGFCIDVWNDESNCGTCGVVCPAGSRCENGTCLVNCAFGLIDCGDGVCVDLSVSGAHCGACFNSCPLGGVCRSGVCTRL